MKHLSLRERIAIFLIVAGLCGIANAGPVSPCYWSGTTALCMPADGVLAPKHKFYESAGTSGDILSLVAPALAADITVTLPALAGTLATVPAAGVVSSSGSVLTSGGTDTGDALVNTGQGSATTPTWSFVGDTDTGIYRSADGVINVSTNDAVRVTIDSNGDTDFTATTGNAHIDSTPTSATTPTYSFVGDTNLGLYRITTDMLGVATNGAEAGRIDTNGDWEFGSQTAGNAHLDSTPGSATTPTYAFNSDIDTGMYRSTTNVLNFSTNATLRLTIGATGGVIIADTGNTGGNVVHGCTRRSNSVAGSDTTVSCTASVERVMGGGCDYTGGSSTLTFLRLAFPDSDSSYRCIYTGTAPTNTVAYAVCCIY